MLVLGWGAWSAIFGNVESKGDIIVLIMSNKQTAPRLLENFKNIK